MPDTPPNFPKRQASKTEHTLQLHMLRVNYTANAEWQTLYEHDKPVAEMFHVAYLAEPDGSSPRPLTFVFNGGPGAASAYLHMGGLGPQRIAFDYQGSLPRSPVSLVTNQESWLSFTDLVFIDPIGTGFSRSLTDESSEKKAEKEAKTSASESDAKTPSPKESPFWEVERDLNAIGEFIQRFLSRHNRWLSPIFIAGESYGGFRVARLARKLQAEFGIGLSGAILISPALEFSMLSGGDYNLAPWMTLLPTLAATAVHHGCATASTTLDLRAHLNAAEQFARRTLAPLLALGDSLPLAERQVAYQKMAALIGLSAQVIENQGGRIGMEFFARELLRDRQQILGLYDASITAIDPFPNRPLYDGNDPTLSGIDRLFTAAINSHLRQHLRVDTDLTYSLLSMEVFNGWKYDHKGECKQGFLSAVDDLRAGMALNPHMNVIINHGIYDMVTPYFASNCLADLMKLHPQLKENLRLKHYRGGHMFYTWDESRQQWFEDMQRFYVKVTLV
jgi:carboxypeptidase C (cathepsin A)